MKERQEINIKLQIDYECALEENRRKNRYNMWFKEYKSLANLFRKAVRRSFPPAEEGRELSAS